jgi:hypothetical protein
LVVGDIRVVNDDRSQRALRRPDCDDPALRAAAARLARELAAYPAALPDREVAEEALAELGRQAAGRTPPDPEQMRQSLLLVVAAVGSVSRLAVPLVVLREAVEVALARAVVASATPPVRPR